MSTQPKLPRWVWEKIRGGRPGWPEITVVLKDGRRIAHVGTGFGGKLKGEARPGDHWRDGTT